MKQKPSFAEEARMAMYGRILRCPVEDNPDDCPLKDVRKMPLEERIAWMDAKTDEEIIELHQHHVRCLAHKLSTPSFLCKEEGEN